MQGRGKKTERSRMKFGKTGCQQGGVFTAVLSSASSQSVCLAHPFLVFVFPSVSNSLKPLKKEGKLVYDSGLPVPPP